jgi:hypothetical protein
VNFEHLVSVFDPEYASLRLNVTGEASVSSAERSGDDSDIRVVNMMIGDVLMNECMRIVDSGTSFKDLGSKSDVISQAVAGALAGKNITLNSFTITGITPDALSQQGIELRDKMNAAKSMTPADYAKRIEEAQKKAQEQLEKMTPEERQKAQEDAKKAYEAGMLPPNHIRMRAMRWMNKIFVTHIFEEMYIVEYNKLPPAYYALEHCEGHHDYIGPEVPYTPIDGE